jgi:murein DD-endopeptidase MepM/ murein hydrolase activator NlpD
MSTMVPAAESSHSSTRRCAHCGGSTDLRTPHVIIDGNTVRAFCSADCATNSTAPIPLTPEAPPARNPWPARLVRLSLGVPMLFFTSGQPTPSPLPSGQKTASLPAMVIAAPRAEPAPVTFGPNWPPTEQDWMAEITSDTWIHPLDGPKRRMPVSDSRVFGAERAGDRPGECRNGHCGVDLSGPWGEPVHAVHDGVVDRVQRGPNEEHGGLYVRLAHRDGTIFSQYFHLAAIPRQLQPGVHVKVGDVIGLVGDTGVKHSAQHLHFTLSVRPSTESTETYMDPEPLIALWPLRIAVDENNDTLTTRVAPGVPRGAATKKSKKKRDVANAASTADEAAPAAAE